MKLVISGLAYDKVRLLKNNEHVKKNTLHRLGVLCNHVGAFSSSNP